MTDSGGVQEESTALGVRCVTLRDTTERPITLTEGTNVLAGTSRERIVAITRDSRSHAPDGRRPQYWDGAAAGRIVDILARRLSTRHEWAA
jgi:UDP-N-acetylglucosamine 2-epimerase (non-hydrolysing)